MPTVQDYRYSWLKTRTGLTNKSASDMERTYYAGLSGLSPATKYSLRDHKYTYLKAQTGKTGSMNDLLMVFLNAYPGSIDDKLFNYYKAG